MGGRPRGKRECGNLNVVPRNRKKFLENRVWKVEQ